MKTTIEYVESGYNSDNKFTPNLYTIKLGDIVKEVSIPKFASGDRMDLKYYVKPLGEAICSILKENGCRYTYPGNIVEDFVEYNNSSDIESDSISFDSFVKLYVRVVDMNGIFKYEFSNYKNEVYYYHLDSKFHEYNVPYCNDALSEKLGFPISIDFLEMAKKLEHKHTNFEIGYDADTLDYDSELVNPVVIKIGYYSTKNKYVLLYKSCFQMVDYISIHNTRRSDGLKKLSSVLDSFKNRIRILGQEEVDIGNQKYIYDTIVKFNVLMVEKSYLPHSKFNGNPTPKIAFKNFNIKPTTNILNLNVLEN